MPKLSSARHSAPVHDSNTNKPPFKEYVRQFEAFVMRLEVEISEHGDVLRAGAELICLIDSILKRKKKSVVNTSLPKGINFLATHVSASDAASPAKSRTAPSSGDSGDTLTDPNVPEVPDLLEPSYETLTDEAKELDRELFFVLEQGSIIGPAREVLNSCPANSFVQAWFLLHEDQGNSTIRKRFEVFKGLFGMKCNVANPAKFKADALTNIREFKDADFSIDEIIKFGLLESIPDEYLSLKIVVADRMDQNPTEPIYSFLQSLVNTLDLAKSQPGHAMPAMVADFSRADCTRCGRNGHKRDKCCARKDAHGKPIPGEPPYSFNALKQERKEKGERGKSTPAMHIRVDEQHAAVMKDLEGFKDGLRAELAGMLVAKPVFLLDPLNDPLAMYDGEVADSLLALPVDVSSGDPILDSGCGAHLGPDFTVESTNHRRSICGFAGPDGDTMVTSGTGHLTFETNGSDGSVSLSLSGHHCNIPVNLFSLGQFLREGYSLRAESPSDITLFTII